MVTWCRSQKSKSEHRSISLFPSSSPSLFLSSVRVHHCCGHSAPLPPPSPFLSLSPLPSFSFPPSFRYLAHEAQIFFFFVRRYDGCSRSPITGLQFRHSLRRKFLDSRKDGSFSADQSRSSFAPSSTAFFFSNIVDSPEIDEASVNIS